MTKVATCGRSGGPAHEVSPAEPGNNREQNPGNQTDEQFVQVHADPPSRREPEAPGSDSSRKYNPHPARRRLSEMNSPVRRSDGQRACRYSIGGRVSATRAPAPSVSSSEGEADVGQSEHGRLSAGQIDQLVAALHIALRIDVAEMEADCALRDEQVARDLGIAHAGDHEGQHIALALGQFDARL